MHSWYQRLWEKYTGKDDELKESGFLHRADGSLVLAPDAAKRWPVANILPGSPYRDWLLSQAEAASAYTDGIMVDHPMPFVEWEHFQTPVECTEAEYKEACLSFIAELKQRTRCTVIVNLSTIWWYTSGRDHVNLQRAVAACDGVYFQSGGCWTLSGLKDKWVVMGGQTPLVFVGEDK